MILSPPQARAVAAGRKTTHRVPANGPQCSSAKVGVQYPVKPGRSKDPICHVEVTEITQQRLGDITYQDARAEGFRTTQEFKAQWVRQHNAGWVERELLDKAQAIEDQCLLDPEGYVLCRRFDLHHAHRWVHVIRFKVVSDRPKYLAPKLGYTSSSSRAVDKLEVIDPAMGYVERAREESMRKRSRLQQERAQSQRMRRTGQAS